MPVTICSKWELSLSTQMATFIGYKHIGCAKNSAKNLKNLYYALDVTCCLVYFTAFHPYKNSEV